jgi:hypothetical protein
MGIIIRRKKKVDIKKITHEELMQRLEEKNKWLKEKLEELNKKMNGMKEKVEKDEKVDFKIKDEIFLNMTKKELHEKPIKELFEEVKEERIIYCQKRIQRVEENIKNSEKKLKDAKDKKDEKSIKKYKELIESLKKINTDLQDSINRINEK